ncbi:hypothetical protein A6U96_14040 [Agrobacterium tumefaciens]|nr:hypothetical protein A6U96_14040 [Agrobacterium tumefaciens]
MTNLSKQHPFTPKEQLDQIKQILDLYKNDVGLFAETLFDIKLRPKQIEICNAFKDNKLSTIRGGVGFGKTLTMAVLLWWSLVCHNEVVVTIYGPNETQLKTATWKEVTRLHDKMKKPFKDFFDITASKATRKSNSAECYAEWKLANPDNPAASRGIHATNNFVIVDEATGIPDIIYTEAILNVLSDENPKICLVSNPTKTDGYFWRTHNDPTISHKWVQVVGKASDKPNMTKQDLEDLIAQYGGTTSIQYRTHILGEFPLSNSSGLIPRDWIDKASNNEDILENPLEPYIWGVDVGGDGENADRSVIIIRNDKMVVEIKEFRGLDPVQLGHRVYELYRATPRNKRPVAICVDGTGIGSGTVSILKEYEIPYKDVRVGTSPTRGKDRFFGLRDQLWWDCRTWFEGEDCRIPNHPELINELALPNYDQDRGKIKVEDKKSLRKKTQGKSTDFADALCLTFAISPSQYKGKWKYNQKITGYNYSAYE